MNNLETFFNQIEQLELAEIPDDKYIHIPTKFAVDRAIYILSQLDKWMGTTYPGYVTLESRGGIDINWDIDGIGVVMYRVRDNANIDDSVFWTDDRTDYSLLLKNPPLSKVAILLEWLFCRNGDVDIHEMLEDADWSIMAINEVFKERFDHEWFEKEYTEDDILDCAVKVT